MSIENQTPGQEVPKTQEELKARLSTLTAEADSLRELITSSGENIDVELGSEEYIDHGYSARLREIEPEIESLETMLKDFDDQDAAQRNLGL